MSSEKEEVKLIQDKINELCKERDDLNKFKVVCDYKK